MASSNLLRRTRAFNASGWPWLKLTVSGPYHALEGKKSVRLSRHVLNLRPGVAVIEPEAESGERSRDGVAVNFLPSLIQDYSLSRALSSFLEKHPLVAELSLVTVVEAAVELLDLVWGAAFWFFLRLAGEASAIGGEVALDVREFARITWLIVGAPFRVVSLPRYSPAQAFGPRQLGQLAAFTLLAAALVMPVKGIATWQQLSARGTRALSIAQMAIDDLRTGGEMLTQGQAGSAAGKLESAREGFAFARTELQAMPEQFTHVLGSLPGPQRVLGDAAHVLSASEAVSTAATLAAQHWTELLENIESGDLRDEVARLGAAVDEIRPYIEKAISEIALVRAENLPEGTRPTFIKVQQRLERIEQAFDSVFSVPAFLRSALMSDAPRTYVVLFQNNAELRPTGGFAGSLALIRIQDGQVQSVSIPGGGPYDFQGSLSRIVRPPEPLRLVRGTWQLQDANWFFDFPSSAQKAIWFVRESGGPEADGVIALTADVVQDVLRLTGPVDMPAYGKAITADNFLRETQEAVELDYDRSENRPKQFIADLAPALLDKALQLPGAQYSELVRILNRAFVTRGIQAYFSDSDLESRVAALGWGGEVQPSASDYLAIVRTNIGGGKTDQSIRERVRHTVNVATNGDITVQLSLNRQHQGDPSDIFTSRRNVTYLRFYVPQGATLLGTDGFTPPPSSYFRPVPENAEMDEHLTKLEHEVGWHSASGTRVTEEFGKTVFGNWLALSPGENKTVSLTYRLPFRLSSGGTWQDLRRYSVLFQRQAGVQAADFVSVLGFAPGYRLRWQESSQELSTYPSQVEFRSDWTQDEYYGVVVEKEL